MNDNSFIGIKTTKLVTCYILTLKELHFLCDHDNAQIYTNIWLLQAYSVQVCSG